MAQKREKEVTELKVPESLPLRTPTIPVSPQQPQPHLSGNNNFDDSSRSKSYVRSPENSDLKLSDDKPRSNSISERSDLDNKNENDVVFDVNRPLKRPREANRCSGEYCRRKLGLIGFRCRCGDMFCSEHRYSDRHDCGYDYKAAGKEAIARENPVVKAAKILKV
jgi:hypothetical protein